LRALIFFTAIAFSPHNPYAFPEVSFANRQDAFINGLTQKDGEGLDRVRAKEL